MKNTQEFEEKKNFKEKHKIKNQLKTDEKKQIQDKFEKITCPLIVLYNKLRI